MTKISMKYAAWAGVAVLVASITYLLTPPTHNACLDHGIHCPTVIAHRGASYWAPEATEPAYALGLALGADYLEFDLRRSSDGHLIVFHDDTLERTSNVSDVFPGRTQDPVGSFTLSELQKLDVGSWFNAVYPERAREAFVGQKILTLEEALNIAETAERRVGIYIETKQAPVYSGIEAQLVEALSERGWINSKEATGRVILQSFYPSSLTTLRQLAPSVPRVLLLHPITIEDRPWDVVLDVASEHHGIGPFHELLTPDYVQDARERGLVVHTFTVNDVEEFQYYTQLGVDGFFTDRCGELLDFYGRPSASSAPDLLQTMGY